MTTRYKLNPEVREKIPAEFLERWAEALKTSNQCRGTMCNESDTAHCCLCVAAILEGAEFDDYRLSALPDEMSGDPKKSFPNTAMLQTVVASVGQEDLFFAKLNDQNLTHPQISHLITHGWVEV